MAQAPKSKPADTSLIPQHKRMAMGLPIGQNDTKSTAKTKA